MNSRNPDSAVRDGVAPASGGKGETITELIRRLARLYAEGRIFLSEEPLEDIISSMRESRERSTPRKFAIRDSRASR